MKFAGAVLVAGSLAFVAVFSYLAANFGYPEILDRSAAEVLPRLLQGGQRLRTVWLIYGVLPLVFVFAHSIVGQRSRPAIIAIPAVTAELTPSARRAGAPR